MKKVSGLFVLSTTEKKKIAAHCRAIAKKAAFTGHVEAWFNTESGRVDYVELVGLEYVEASENMELIYSARTNK